MPSRCFLLAFLESETWAMQTYKHTPVCLLFSKVTLASQKPKAEFRLLRAPPFSPLPSICLPTFAHMRNNKLPLCRGALKIYTSEPIIWSMITAGNVIYYWHRCFFQRKELLYLLVNSWWFIKWNATLLCTFTCPILLLDYSLFWNQHSWGVFFPFPL